MQPLYDVNEEIVLINKKNGLPEFTGTINNATKFLKIKHSISFYDIRANIYAARDKGNRSIYSYRVVSNTKHQ
jgi:hypothetical protein